MKPGFQRVSNAVLRLGAAGVFLLAFGFSVAHAQEHVEGAGSELHCAVCHVAGLTPLPGSEAGKIRVAGSFLIVEITLPPSAPTPVPALSPKLSRAPPSHGPGSRGKPS